mgnify:FL=1
MDAAFFPPPLLCFDVMVCDCDPSRMNPSVVFSFAACVIGGHAAEELQETSHSGAVGGFYPQQGLEGHGLGVPKIEGARAQGEGTVVTCIGG